MQYRRQRLNNVRTTGSVKTTSLAIKESVHPILARSRELELLTGKLVRLDGQPRESPRTPSNSALLNHNRLNSKI